MIGFFALMLLIAALTWLGSYWISWEIQDSRTRPAFAAQVKSDCARLLRRDRATTSPEPSTVVAQTRPVLSARSAG